MNSESPAVATPPQEVLDFFDAFRALVDASVENPAPIVNALTSVILGLNGIIETPNGESFSKSYAKHLSDLSDIDFEILAGQIDLHSLLSALEKPNGG